MKLTDRLVDYFLVVGPDPELVASALASHTGDADAVFVTEYAPKLLARYPPTDFADFVLEEATVPLLCFPSDLKLQPEIEAPVYHSFVMTKGDGASVYGFCFTVYEETLASDHKRAAAVPTLSREHAYDHEHEEPNRTSAGDNEARAYVPRCLCLISHWPLCNAFHAFLQQLHLYSVTPQALHVPVECQIVHLFHHVPLPQPGSSPVSFGMFDPIVIRRPPERSLPLFDIPMTSLFSCLDVDNIILLMQCVLLEKRILLQSSVMYKLTDVAETITKLIFPFCWTGCYVPNLSYKLRHLLEVPMPYIIGLFDETNSEEVPPEVVWVKLDENSIRMNETLPRLPEKDEQALRDALAPISATKGQPTDTMDAATVTLHVRESFLRFFVSIFYHYQGFLLMPQIDQSITTNDQAGADAAQAQESAPLPPSSFKSRADMPAPVAPIANDFQMAYSLSSLNLAQLSDTIRFDMNGFLHEQPPASRPFLCELLQTQQFTSFIEARLDGDDPEIEFFDSCIDAYRAHQENGALRLSLVKDDRNDAAPVIAPVVTHDGFDFSHEYLDESRLKHFPVFRPRTFPVMSTLLSSGSENVSKRRQSMFVRSAQLLSRTRDEDEDVEAARARLRERLEQTKNQLILACSSKYGDQKRSLEDIERAQDDGVLGFCNLIERIFAHGRVQQPNDGGGDAALWSFLKGCPHPTITHDVVFVEHLPHLKANVSRARAWIRLTLEKQQLYNYLDLMLLDTKRLCTLYKPHAFLRDENSRLVLLMCVLSLMEVDFRSLFTRQYDSSVTEHRAPPGKMLRSQSQSSSMTAAAKSSKAESSFGGFLTLGRKSTVSRRTKETTGDGETGLPGRLLTQASLGSLNLGQYTSHAPFVSSPSHPELLIRASIDLGGAKDSPTLSSSSDSPDIAKSADQLTKSADQLTKSPEQAHKGVDAAKSPPKKTLSSFFQREKKHQRTQSLI